MIVTVTMLHNLLIQVYACSFCINLHWVSWLYSALVALDCGK